MLIFSVQISEISEKNIIGKCWSRIAENKQKIKNKTAKMRKCLTNLSRFFKCGAVLRPDACPQCFSWFFNWIPKVQKCVDLCKSCRSRQELSNEYLPAKFGFDTAENEPLKVCQKLAKTRSKS